jgi:hypothetical protein
MVLQLLGCEAGSLHVRLLPIQASPMSRRRAPSNVKVREAILPHDEPSIRLVQATWCVYRDTNVRLPHWCLHYKCCCPCPEHDPSVSQPHRPKTITSQEDSGTVPNYNHQLSHQKFHK